MKDNEKLVFVSYCWSNEDHILKVRKLVDKLKDDGINVLIDVDDLKPGNDKFVFMEESILNDEVDKVLIICDKKYSDKANGREGGVGTETQIITPEMYGNAKQTKFIPVVFEKDKNNNPYLPIYLKTIMYIDYSDENEEKYKELLKTIKDDELNNESNKTVNNNDKLKNLSNLVTSSDDFIVEYMECMKQFYDKSYNVAKLYENTQKLLEYRNLFLSWQEELLLNDSDFGRKIANVYEEMYNTLFDAKFYENNTNSISNECFDIFRVHIWELFICTIALLLNKKKFVEMNRILKRTYFLKNSPLSNEKHETSYSRFRYHSSYYEECRNIIKEYENVYNVQAAILVNERVKTPFYSKEQLIKADMFLYQIYNALDILDLDVYAWFPMTYVYTDSFNKEWNILKSKAKCEELFVLLDVENIEDLKEKLKNCKHNNEYRYSLCPRSAKSILDEIKIEEIGIFP